MPLRAPKMYGFIFGFQRLVWWPKWTPASSSCFMLMAVPLEVRAAAMVGSAAGATGAGASATVAASATAEGVASAGVCVVSSMWFSGWCPPRPGAAVREEPEIMVSGTGAHCRGVCVVVRLAPWLRVAPSGRKDQQGPAI
jgi:hypothetical protein